MKVYASSRLGVPLVGAVRANKTQITREIFKVALPMAQPDGHSLGYARFMGRGSILVQELQFRTSAFGTKRSLMVFRGGCYSRNTHGP